MLEWVPMGFKSIKNSHNAEHLMHPDLEVGDQTPLEVYESPRSFYNHRRQEITWEEGWVPDPEVVAMLTVHTKGAHSP